MFLLVFSNAVILKFSCSTTNSHFRHYNFMSIDSYIVEPPPFEVFGSSCLKSSYHYLLMVCVVMLSDIWSVLLSRAVFTMMSYSMIYGEKHHPRRKIQNGKKEENSRLSICLEMSEFRFENSF